MIYITSLRVYDYDFTTGKKKYHQKKCEVFYDILRGKVVMVISGKILQSGKFWTIFWNQLKK